MFIILYRTGECLPLDQPLVSISYKDSSSAAEEEFEEEFPGNDIVWVYDSGEHFDLQAALDDWLSSGEATPDMRDLHRQVQEHWTRLQSLCKEGLEKTLNSYEQDNADAVIREVFPKISAEGFSGRSCSYCTVFLKGVYNCEGCPVFKYTGLNGCEGTPYYDARKALTILSSYWIYGSRDNREIAVGYWYSALNLVTEELNFLKKVAEKSP